MDLNSFQQFKTVDQADMLGEIRGLPNQFNDAFHLGKQFPLPQSKTFSSVVIAGMGGSAIGADLLLHYDFQEFQIPISILRNYDLPGWASGKNCLVICSSHSGNTEETNSVLVQAIERDCTIVVISTGGKLISKAINNNLVTWKFEHKGQPRAAVGFSFGLLLCLFARLSLIPEQANAVNNTLSAMNALIKKIDTDVPVVKNPAKRLAGQLVDQYVTVISAEHLAPVARRWKTQINELAKSWAQFEFIPEADHNTLAGVLQPSKMLPKMFSIFLESGNFHPRNKKRIDLTFTEFMVAGICTDKIDFSSDEKLTEVWKAILFGDFVSYYLAMIYEIDPTPVEAIESLKAQMQ